MVNYITILIKTLLGKSNIIPSQLTLLSPTIYGYIRKELDNIVLHNTYCKIEYDLITNGKIMYDYMEYIGGIIILVPKINTGYKISKECRKLYIPQRIMKFKEITNGKAIVFNEPKRINKEKRLEENVRMRRVLDILSKKRREKKRKRYLKQVDLNIKDTYCGFKRGFLL